MVGEAAFVGENLTKGLRKMGHTVVFDNDLHWSQLFRKKYGKQFFDIVHIHSPNFKKLGIVWRYLSKAKLVCHWHGSDLRHPYKAFPVYHLLKRIADFHLYSTIDLRWWLRRVPDDKKMLFICPVDTTVFRDYGTEKKGVVTFSGGGKSFKVHRVKHENMPDYLNQYAVVNVHNADGLDDGLLSVIAMEAAACGCFVPQLPWLNRKWVVENADVDLQTKKLLEVYRRVLEQ